MTANATANIPFALINAVSGEDYDTSADWKNKVGFMPDPVELLRLWRLSLTMTNMAYGFMEGKTLGKRMLNTNLRYIVPSTLTPVVDNEGLKLFKRSIQNVTTDYLPLPEPGGRILYMWRLDHTTEILPSPKTEYLAMMNAAGILYYSDTFIKSFFQRGGIKPTMLSVKGNILKDAMEKLENVWTRVIRGEYKYLGKVFNGDSITASVIGEGVDSLKDQGITDNSLSAVAMAIGMPLSLLLANSANYATAQTEYVSWYRDSLTPWCVFMAGCLNNQIFIPMGLYFEFRPEMTDPGQEDEVARASAFGTYVTAGVKPSLAAQIVGIEMPAGYEFEDLDPEEASEPEPTPEPVQEPVEETQYDETEMQAEMRRWRKKATKALKAGKSALVEFVSDIIPDDARQYIERRLIDAKNENEIKAAFVLCDPLPAEIGQDIAAIMALAEAINKAAGA
jgi:hypothetical protein